MQSGPYKNQASRHADSIMPKSLQSQPYQDLQEQERNLVETSIKKSYNHVVGTDPSAANDGSFVSQRLMNHMSPAKKNQKVLDQYIVQSKSPNAKDTTTIGS
jgi:hypothetical protein